MTIEEKINVLVASGNPIFILDNENVVMPIEAEYFYTNEEISEMITYIKRQIK